MKRDLTYLCCILGILSIESLDLMEERDTNETLLTTGCDYLMKLTIALSKNNADVSSVRERVARYTNETLVIERVERYKLDDNDDDDIV